MRVKIETIGLSSLSRAAGSASWDFEFGGKTAADLINALIAAYGQEAREALLNDRGEVDEEVLVIINGNSIVSFDSIQLNEGDEVCFFLAMVGG